VWSATSARPKGISDFSFYTPAGLSLLIWKLTSSWPQSDVDGSTGYTFLDSRMKRRIVHAHADPPIFLVSSLFGLVSKLLAKLYVDHC
jgi:hypothetical protein